MLRAAIIGCGKIADDHASILRHMSGCEIVAACDREPLMARQLSERFPVGAVFSDLSEMLTEAAPDVVHITTPPQSHYDLARQCLDAGCHVYVEKPFALSEREARDILETANERGLRVTAGHDFQFSHVARRMRALVAGGFLGDGPVHMESVYCYPIANTGYAGALLGDERHWVRRLPGKLLQNIISHGIARIVEFLPGESPKVLAHGFTSSALREMGEDEIVDELRVIIAGEDGTTAYFTFSSQMRPSLHQFRIYGSSNGIILDQDDETLIRLRGKQRVSYAAKFVPPVGYAAQYLGNLIGNGRRFLANDFHMKAGMRHLISEFYRSIEENTPLPVSYREIVLTARIMDAIFSQLETPTVRAAAASGRTAPASIP